MSIIFIVFFFIGGILEGQDFEGTSNVEIFDPVENIWMLGPPLNVNRFRLKLFVILGVLYAVGGDRDERGRWRYFFCCDVMIDFH